MKKPFLLFSLLSFIFSLGITFGYSTEDVSNANSLADQGIVVKQTITSKYRLDDEILRQEVVAMALKIKGIPIPENTPCKKYFADAIKNDWVCRAVELAADNGIITRANKYTNPGKYVTRAEALAMIMKAGGITIDTFNQDYFNTNFHGLSDVYWTDSYKFSSTWMRDVFFSYMKYVNIDVPGQGQERISDSGSISFDYRIDSLATRAEVFAFTKNILSPINNQYTVELLNNPENKFPDEPKILYLTQGDSKIEIDRGYIENPLLFGDFLIYDWSLTGGTQKKIYSLKDHEILDRVSWGKIDSTKKYIFGCDPLGLNSCTIFSTEMSRTIYTQYSTNENDPYNDIEYLGNNKFQITTENNKIINIDLNGAKEYHSANEILNKYYWLIAIGSLKTAYGMRSPSGMTYEKFKSLYENLSTATESYDNNNQTWQRVYNSITIGDDSEIKNLGNNTYEFFVYTNEGGVKSTYKVKSKVNLQNFTIDNISSVKQ